MKKKIYDWLTTPHVWNTRTFNINIPLLILWTFATTALGVSLYVLNSDTMLNTPMRPYIQPLLSIIICANFVIHWLISWSTGLVVGLTVALNFSAVKPSQHAPILAQYIYSFFETVNRTSIIQLVTDVVVTDQV